MTGPRKYNRHPKLPLESKIQVYLSLLGEGWSLNYARSKSGLSSGRIDYKKALEDIRVQQAHFENKSKFLEKQKNKIC